jgi:hypothetical protein
MKKPFAGLLAAIIRLNSCSLNVQSVLEIIQNSLF